MKTIASLWRWPHFHCRNPNLGPVTKARAYKGGGQEWSSWVTFHALRTMGECDGMNFHTPKRVPILGVGLLNLHRVIIGVKTNWIMDFLISLKRSWNVNVLNGFAWPIWVLKT
jgi:hypothetical protein